MPAGTVISAPSVVESRKNIDTFSVFLAKKTYLCRCNPHTSTMTSEYQIRILPQQAYNELAIRDYLAHAYGLDIRTITAVRTLKRSIDARQRQIYVNLTVRAYINEQPANDEYVRTTYPNVEGRPAVIVVGAGPGGLFAALRLIEQGMRPIVVERGKDVRNRKKDLARISREHLVDPESN